MEHVVIDFFALVIFQLLRLTIIDCKQVVAEGGDHEELLHHGVHVADAAEVSESDILLNALIGP